MEEFIFGMVAVDELKLIRHRTSLSGVQHLNEISPRDPQPGQPVTISVRVSPQFPVDHLACYYTTDGSQPRGSMGKALNGIALPLKRTSVEWDNFIWGYTATWQATLPGQTEGTLVRYRIGAWKEGGEETFADWPDVKATTDEAAGAFFHGKPLTCEWIGDPQEGRTFLYSVDRLAAPQWAREAVLYHIFVDRFYPGKHGEWLQVRDLNGFFGGTLWGVTEKLGHVAELGATCLWLSPIFPSPTSHGYDATEYRAVEPRLGGDDALRELISACHGRGMRVILDLTCNHLSNQHPLFLDAQSNPASRYRRWFHFDDSELGYRAFYGVASMPQINLDNLEAREWMLENARFWLSEFDIDGYRLDHANGPSQGFWSEFWVACKGVKGDCLCFGEIVEPANVLPRYYGRLDGTLDFLLAEAMRKTFGYGAWSEAVFEQFLQRHHAYLDRDFLMFSFIDNHDMDRFLFIAGDSKSNLQKAAEIQMKLAGPPIIYYGTEIGLSQAMSRSKSAGMEMSRGAMLWDNGGDRELYRFYQRLIRERAEAKPWGISAPAD
jgi:cyclomaltodextrinase